MVVVVQVLQFLVRYELHRAVRHAEKTGQEAAVQAAQPLLPGDLSQGVEEAAVLAGRVSLNTT